MNKMQHSKLTRRNHSKSGFTMIELSLSIAFIAILSITIVLIITNAISSYHRGLTLNKLNTAGMDLVDDLRAAVQNSPARSVISLCAELFNDATEVKNCQDDYGNNLVSAKKSTNVEIGKNNNIPDLPIFGVFCTGAYSYIWNSGYFFNEDEYNVNNKVHPAALKYNSANASGIIATGFKLLKVEDENRSVCTAATIGPKDASGNKYNIADNAINDNLVTCNADAGCVIDITSYDIVDEEPVDIMMAMSQSGDSTEKLNSNLAIYDLSSSIPAESASNNSLFYSVSFILGTIQGGININSTGNFCATPGGFNADVENFDYCAINKFNFAAQASGG